MLGLGEKPEEVRQTMIDLRNVGVEILTLGQYLRPTRRHMKVEAYVHPNEFDAYRVMGEELGELGPVVVLVDLVCLLGDVLDSLELAAESTFFMWVPLLALRHECLTCFCLALGFAFVASGPMVRSSYRAGELFVKNILRKREAEEAAFPKMQEGIM